MGSLKNRLAGLKWHAMSRTVGGDRAARAMGVEVGEDCRILSGRYGDDPHLITIGDRVTISGGVVLITHDGAAWLARDERGRRYRFGRITIGNDVFVGSNAIIMQGVNIGDRVIVGAGSVVTKSIPSGQIVAGNPARIIGSFDDWLARTLRECPTDADLEGDLEAQVARHADPDRPPMVRGG
jgi:acetyltransferase-like isoleucine patch superfamily enzyme